MSDRTPGPWWYMPLHDVTGKPKPEQWERAPVFGIVEIYEDDPEIAVVGPHGSEADARLMSAAPELLAACKAALNDRMYREWPAIADLLKAAIVKAEGGSDVA